MTRDTPAVEATVWLDGEALAAAIHGAADPATARTALERLVEADPSLGTTLLADELLREVVIAIACASQSLTTAMTTEPTLLEWLRSEVTEPEDGLRSVRDLDAYRSTSIAQLVLDGDADGPRALRRWKRRELLRIAARDLVGIADLPTVARELAALAQVSLERALELAEPSEPFVVIGMGKLGGVELNYASDVDVLFVHEGESAEGDRVARAVLAAMTEPLPDGIVFRTDADLRPEGRAGPLSRSLGSYAAYYDRWAQPWEFQALVKARPVAGDASLGARFMKLAQRHIWSDELDPDAIREIRAMKARSEAETARRGLERSRAQARAGRDPRHRVRRAAPAARPRS